RGPRRVPRRRSGHRPRRARGGRVTATRRGVLALVEAPRSRIALSVGLGAATVLCGVGLMATAGYLISSAADRPAVVSPPVAIVFVRFFGLTRPLARYFELPR